MKINKQYEEIGKNFIEGQKDYFSNKIDYARVFIKKSLPDLKGLKVLDVGCGAGVDIVSYENLGAKEVYGIDSSEFMIEEAKKIVKNPERLLVGNMEEMPFGNSFFDVIIGRFSLHYLENLDKAYEEFNRVLKTKGTLIFIVHHNALSFMQAGAKDYQTRSVINMKLYNNSVKIQFPHHTLKDYFSETFFKYFILEYLDEESVEGPEYPNKWNIPGFIGFKAVKR